MQYQIIYSKTKHAYVRIMSDFSLKLTIPTRKSKDKELENILLEKWKKLLERYKKINTKKEEYITKDYVIIFWEKILTTDISWDINIFLKKKIYIETKEILDKYSDYLQIPYNKLSIKSLKSKWGSCSWTNNISINLKLIHLPKAFLEYVVIHEVCHLKEKNHSKKFWDLVWKYFPEYKNIRKELKSVNI